jgi:hypothetical protein
LIPLLLLFVLLYIAIAAAAFKPMVFKVIIVGEVIFTFVVNLISH